MQGVIGGSINGYFDGSFGDLNNSNAIVGFQIGLVQCGGCGEAPTYSIFDRANGSTISVSFAPDQNFVDYWDYTVSGTMIVPVSSNSTDGLEYQVSGSTDVAGDDLQESNGNADLQVGGAQVYNAAGTQLLSGVTLTSDSGFDYTQPIPASPEPATLGLIAASLATMAWRLRSSAARKQ